MFPLRWCWWHHEVFGSSIGLVGSHDLCQLESRHILHRWSTKPCGWTSQWKAFRHLLQLLSKVWKGCMHSMWLQVLSQKLPCEMCCEKRDDQGVERDGGKTWIQRRRKLHALVLWKAWRDWVARVQKRRQGSYLEYFFFKIQIELYSAFQPKQAWLGAHFYKCKLEIELKVQIQKMA